MSSSLNAPTIPSDDRMPARAGWFIALGILFVLLGVLAWLDVVAATLASTVLIGLMLIFAGVVQIAHALAHRGTARAGAWLSGLIGLLYILGGGTIVEEPVTGSVLLTAFLAACLIFTGVARVAWAAGHRRLGSWWGLLLSGIVALLVGILIYLSLPWSGLWLLGTLVAIELIVAGISALMCGLSLHRHTARLL